MKITLLELESLVNAGYNPKILTPSGYEKITDTYRKNSDGLFITFTDNSHIKCSEFHLIWDNEWKTANQLQKGQIIGSKQIYSIEKISTQDWIDFTIDAEHSSYYHNDILHHNSGKSFVIYLIVRLLLEHTEGKILISVPSINLVKQLHKDFRDYETDAYVSSKCYELSAGASKTTNQRVIISTWKMLFDMIPKCDVDYFDQFDTYICDEAHQADSKALGKIIDKLSYVKYRFGFTGTLDGSKSHEMQCRSWFGSIIKANTTKDLMEREILSPISVKCIDIRYDKDECKAVSKMDYQEEIKFIINHQKRNDYLLELAMTQENNTLLLFNLVDKHGLKLFEQAKEVAKKYNKNVRLIVGNINGDEREEIRGLMEKENNVVLFASFGTMSVRSEH